MPEFTPEMLLVAASVGGAFIICLFLTVNIYTIFSLKAASKERQNLNKEIFGLVKKIEGLTASRREQMLKNYDDLLESLSARLPAAVANHTGKIIFDAESKILSRLAEIEPALIKDEKNKEKLDELIQSMEGLERSIVTLTSDAVKDVMINGRRALYETVENGPHLPI